MSVCDVCARVHAHASASLPRVPAAIFMDPFVPVPCNYRS